MLPAVNAKKLAQGARIQILRMTHSAKASHVGSALSVVDILATLYSGAFQLSPLKANAPDRDIVILSKGHAAAAYYSVLALSGYFPIEWLSRYCEDGAELGGHVTSKGVPGIELSTGSLGHGMPYGAGIALSKLRSNQPGRIFTIISDGECDEGTTWEAALFAAHHELNNFCVIIDRNRLQSLGDTSDTLEIEPLADKWEKFGWDVVQVDGHSPSELMHALKPRRKPLCVIANTTKGRGVVFMENSVAWHYKSPNEEELNLAISQIENGLI